MTEERLADAALGLGDDLLGDDDDVALEQVGAGGDQLTQVRAGLDLGQALDRDDVEVPQSYAQRPGGSPRPPAGLYELAGQGDDVGGGVEVERERGQLLDREGDAGRAGGGDVAGAASLAEGGCDRVRRRQRRGALVPVPWRSGTIAT